MAQRLDEWWVIVETNKQQFAVAAKDVREIVALPDVTAVPHCRPQNRGVMNLRGRVIPLFDMRKQFGWQSVPEELEDFCKLMSQREQDHLNWLKELEKSVVEGTEFRLAKDPHLCAFGKWYYSYHSESPWVTALLRKFESPHNKIHALAASVDEMVRNGNSEEALQLIESERNGTLQEMMSLFHQLRELMRETVKELAMVISQAQGAFAISVDRAVAVERVIPDMIKDVQADPAAVGGGVVNRAVQRSSTGALAMILEPDVFLH